MGKINIRGGSPLKINFEFANGDKFPGAPGIDVELVRTGNKYHVRRVGGAELQTAAGPAANITATVPGGPGKQDVEVDFAE